MSATPAPQGPSQVSQPTADYSDEDERGYGWVAFAGTLLLLVRSIDVIQGIAAIGNANFFVHNTHYVVGSLNTWGWVVLIIGACQFFGRSWRVCQESVLSVGWRGRSGCQFNRAVADDPGVFGLVVDDLHVGHPGDVWTDRLRQANQRELIGAGS